MGALADLVIPTWAKYLIIALLVAAAAMAGAYYAAKYKDAIWQEKFSTYEKELSELHQKNLNEVLNMERVARDEAAKIEVKYHETTDQIKNLRSDNARLARELGGLRDPYAKPVTGVGNATGTAPGNTADQAAAGRLSKEASRFLLDFSADADRAAAYANACYDWINRGKSDIAQ